MKTSPGHGNNVDKTIHVPGLFSGYLIGIDTIGYNEPTHCQTVLVIIKLKYIPVPLRFRCGSGKVNLCLYFIMFCDI